MMTEKQFNEIPAGNMFATGVLPNSADGIFMTRDGGKLRWVAIKGYANDWTIYCYWSHKTEDWIKAHGDKVTTETHIKRCVDCNEAVFKKYRY